MAERVGRPRGSSRDMLQEAAAELFLEQTYARTSIDQIARRAGVSRNTFFNYFDAKSDLLWVEVDESLAQLPAALAAVDSAVPVTDALKLAILDVASTFGPSRVPWALTQSELMGTTDDLEASALSRLAVHARRAADIVAVRTGRDVGDLICTSFAMSLFAAVGAAAASWAAAGVSRGNLAPYVDAALSPVCAGFRAELAFTDGRSDRIDGE